MNIVVPLAGKDIRFENEFGITKPLVTVFGKPLIVWCMELLPFPLTKTTFVCLRDDQEKYQIVDRLATLFPLTKVVLLDAMTEGAASTVLALEDIIRTDEELLVFLADIYFRGDVKKAIENRPAPVKGIIPTFLSNNKKYSYAHRAPDGFVDRVAEKDVIAEHASAGCYYFAHGRDFVWAAKQMIAKNRRVNNLFYLCPVYSELIERGDKIQIMPVEFVAGFGSPEEVRAFSAPAMKR